MPFVRLIAEGHPRFGLMVVHDESGLRLGSPFEKKQARPSEPHVAGRLPNGFRHGAAICLDNFELKLLRPWPQSSA